jgi:hypothetical protein
MGRRDRGASRVRFEQLLPGLELAALGIRDQAIKSKLRLDSLRERHQELVALGFFIRNPFNQISKRCPGVAFYAEGNDK